MMNRRIFIKAGIYAGIGIMVVPFSVCSKDNGINDDNGILPPHPAFVPDVGINLYGSIIDEQGKPIAGVVVSDGYQCVTTDGKGIYQMKRGPMATTVFYSVPEQYAVKTVGAVSSAASFFALLSGDKRYNFTLKKLPSVENDFTLICIGDPQVTSDAEIERYKAETMADLKPFVEASPLPCYGLVLGDTVNDQPGLFTKIRNTTGSIASMPYFTTIGNHDKTGGSASGPRDSTAYSAVFGPVNYSWNRGKVHFIALDDVIFSNKDNYTGGLEDFQIEWLRQDLSHVPKDKTIIVYYHIPVRDSSEFKNREAFLDLMKGYAGVHFMVGHTHYNENFLITRPVNIYEHIHGAARGAWWKSNVNCDGTPNGYAVYDVRGTELTNWYYKPVKYSLDFQIRLHWGDTQFGGQYGYFSYNKGGNTIVANVWNADSGWIIEAFEDGVAAGWLVKQPALIDAFAAGYHVGVLNRNPANYGATGNGSNGHAYLHTLKNPAAQTIEIRATDRFGKTYSQTEIIDNLATA